MQNSVVIHLYIENLSHKECSELIDPIFLYLTYSLILAAPYSIQNNPQKYAGN